MAKVFWFTGLSGAGKTTVAKQVVKALKNTGKNVVLLDGDVLRDGLCADLGFSLADRAENIRRVAEMAKLLVENDIICICTFISPTSDIRQKAAEIIGEERFIEIYINTPLSICESRDTKGLYKKVRAGEIKNFTGIDSVYEIPQAPNYILDCVNNSAEESYSEILRYISTLIN